MEENMGNMEENIGKTIVLVSRKGFCLAVGKIINVERRYNYLGYTFFQNASGYLVHEPGCGTHFWLPQPEMIILDKPLNFTIGADLFPT